MMSGAAVMAHRYSIVRADGEMGEDAVEADETGGRRQRRGLAETPTRTEDDALVGCRR